MSMATQIARLQGLRNRLRTKILGLGLDTDPALDLDDCVGIIEGISGTQDITTAGSVYNVAGKQYARVNDRELKPENIVSGKTILGVTGTAAVNPPSGNNIQDVAVMEYGGPNPPATVYPSSGYDGVAQVVPRLVDASPKLNSVNIKSGVTIMGVTGSYETPTETKSPTLAELKAAGITSDSVNIVPSSNKHLSQVTIPQITAAIDSNIVSGNIKAGESILGVIGEYHGQYTIQFGQVTRNNQSILQITTNVTSYHLAFFQIRRVSSSGADDNTVNSFMGCFIQTMNYNSSFKGTVGNYTEIAVHNVTWNISSGILTIRCEYNNNPTAVFNGDYYYCIALSSQQI